MKIEISKLYGEKAAMQAERYQKAIGEFKKLYGDVEYRLFSASGRTEVGGNHTDHNNGCVLAAGVSLDVIAVVALTEDMKISVKSEGYPRDDVDLTELEPKSDEQNTAAALIRGVASGFVNKGRKIGGFAAYTTSDVLKGSGLSSSAAFEVLIGTILNNAYNGGGISDVEIAQTAQYAENVFFGKPSGLMDQMASSVGGFITIDFADTKNPVIKRVPFDFAQSGHSLCIVDTKGNHADLTPDYASIPAEMKSVASIFGKSVLRELSRAELLNRIAEAREKCGDRAVLRAFHFFDENERALAQSEALEKGDFTQFLKLINQSGASSFDYLQNIYSPAHPNEQGLAVGLYTAKQILGDKGACRVHGGGFAGTIQAFVPNELLENFIKAQNNIFGEGSCHVLSIRAVGGAEVIL